MRIQADLTTIIKREWLREIVAGRKQIEYREMKPYWREKLSTVQTPFLLRLINGMQKNSPEVIVRIDKIKENRRTNEYEMNISKVIAYKNWDKKRETPKRG